MITTVTMIMTANAKIITTTTVKMISAVTLIMMTSMKITTITTVKLLMLSIKY